MLHEGDEPDPLAHLRHPHILPRKDHAVLLRERRSGKVIMLLGGVMAAAMLPLHMRSGLRLESLEKSGALLFIWTLYILGVTGAFSVILAIQALRGRRVAS
jgi:hypothetical protein